MTFDSLLVFFETTEFVRQSNLVIYSDRIIIDTFLGVHRCRHLLKKLFDQSCTELVECMRDHIQVKHHSSMSYTHVLN
jgi:hypothetical protein